MDKLQLLKIQNDIVRGMLAEFLGSFIVVVLGESVTAMVVTGDMQPHRYAIEPIGWGFAYSIATHVTNTVTAHLNPAVTFALTTTGQCSPTKTLAYIGAQYMGGFVAAASVYAVYKEAIYDYAGGLFAEGEKITADIFVSMPRKSTSTLTGFTDQVIGTSILLIVWGSLEDHRKAQPKYLQPMSILLAMSGLMYSFAFNCGPVLNPARDLGPRAFAYMIGYGKIILSHRDYDWIFITQMGPYVGGILGAWIYKLAIELHHPSKNMQAIIAAANLTLQSKARQGTEGPSDATISTPL